jgi:hypothetical protein
MNDERKIEEVLRELDHSCPHCNNYGIAQNDVSKLCSRHLLDVKRRVDEKEGQYSAPFSQYLEEEIERRNL